MGKNNKNILLVEDNFIIALAEKTELQKYAYSVFHVSNGQEALETVLAEDSIIDLILMDINLGSGMDGIETARLIQKKKDIPIVFLSSHSEPEIIEKAATVNFYGYVVKESPVSVIDASIKVAFRLFEFERQAENPPRRDRVPELSGYTCDQNCSKYMERGIVRQRERLSSIIEGTELGTWEWNIQTGETNFNKRWAEIIGYTLDELSPISIETWKMFSHPDDLKASSLDLMRHIKGEIDHYEYDIRMRHRDGTWRWVHDKGKVTEWAEDGTPLWMFGTHQDITERKWNEAAVQQKLNEKEILLREVHHRIKNNMTTINSLLNLQADCLDKSSRLIIKQAIGRMESMRVLYEKLVITGKEYRVVPIKNYLTDLIVSIAETFPESCSFLEYENIADIMLNTNEAFLLGLISNELITNSMKYACLDLKKGKITISFRQKEEMLTLIVQDNGKGLKEGFDLRNSTGFGLTLVRMLSKQLGGDFLMESRSGLKSCILYRPNQSATANQGI